jgi:hypothetical protein
MPTGVVFMIYGAAFALGLAMTWWFRPVRWYWHLLSIAAAIGIGLMPPVDNLKGPLWDMTTGAMFVFLITWGVSELLLKVMHAHHHQRPSGHHA